MHINFRGRCFKKAQLVFLTVIYKIISVMFVYSLECAKMSESS